MDKRINVYHPTPPHTHAHARYTQKDITGVSLLRGRFLGVRVKITRKHTHMFYVRVSKKDIYESSSGDISNAVKYSLLDSRSSSSWRKDILELPAYFILFEHIEINRIILLLRLLEKLKKVTGETFTGKQGRSGSQNTRSMYVMETER